MAVPFDLERLEVHGAAVPVVEDVAYQAEEAGSQYATSDSGTLVYLTAATMNPPMALTVVGRDGRAELLSEPDRFVGPALSPSGDRVVIGVKGPDSSQDLWVLDLDRGSRTRITDESGAEPNAIWTRPGGDLLVSYEGAEGVPFFRAGRVPSDGSGGIEPMLESSSGDVIPSGLSPDGRVLTFVQMTDASSDVWTMPVAGGGAPAPFVDTSADEGMPAFSPDGQWIAYQSNESGRFEIYVQPYPGPGRRITVSTDGGVEALWSRDGGELFYRPLDENGVMVARATVDDAHIVFAPPEQLFEGHYDRHPWTTPQLRNYDVTEDGERFIMLRRADASPPRMNVVLNWQSELLERVPHN